MKVTLADLFAAAERQGCPIIHISKLAGHDPIVPNQPCLGKVTGSLLDREPVAATYLLDGAGQETTIIYRQLPTLEAVRSFWLERAGHAPLHAS